MSLPQMLLLQLLIFLTPFAIEGVDQHNKSFNCLEKFKCPNENLCIDLNLMCDGKKNCLKSDSDEQKIRKCISYICCSLMVRVNKSV